MTKQDRGNRCAIEFTLLVINSKHVKEDNGKVYAYVSWLTEQPRN